MKVSWLFPSREYTMLPSKDTDQVLNVNESTTDNSLQDTSDNTSRLDGLKRFHTDYLSRKTYVYIIVYHFGLFIPHLCILSTFQIDTKVH